MSARQPWGFRHDLHPARPADLGCPTTGCLPLVCELETPHRLNRHVLGAGASDAQPDGIRGVRVQRLGAQGGAGVSRYMAGQDVLAGME